MESQNIYTKRKNAQNIQLNYADKLLLHVRFDCQSVMIMFPQREGLNLLDLRITVLMYYFRRKLMDIDGHLLSLGVEAERQHQIISQWESRNNKLYCRRTSSQRRPNTKGSINTASKPLIF